MYVPSAYFLAHLVTSLPLIALQTVIYGLPIYFGCNLRNQSLAGFNFLALSIIMGYTMNGLAWMSISISRVYAVASLVSNMSFTFIGLTSGKKEISYDCSSRQPLIPFNSINIGPTIGFMYRWIWHPMIAIPICAIWYLGHKINPMTCIFLCRIPCQHQNSSGLRRMGPISKLSLLFLQNSDEQRVYRQRIPRLL